MLRTKLLIAGCCLIAVAILISTIGCVKEYSYERQPVNVDTISNDTPDADIVYPQCSLCEKEPDFELSKWSFTVDTFSFCGNVSGAVMLDERKAFTFFGPSACSTDSGLIMTAFFDEPFDTLANYVTADRVTMRYYNHTDTADVFIAYTYNAFYLTIVNYSKATGIMKGIFGGTVVTADNGLAEIKNGKFDIQF